MKHRNPTERLEDELDRAKGLGRWLSDDEQAELDRAADAVARTPGGQGSGVIASLWF